MFLADMEVKGFVHDGANVIQAGEAAVMFGHWQGHAVAVRAPRDTPGAPRGASWMREKVQQQLHMIFYWRI
jgi:hypothetical protein